MRCTKYNLGCPHVQIGLQSRSRLNDSDVAEPGEKTTKDGVRELVLVLLHQVQSDSASSDDDGAGERLRLARLQREKQFCEEMRWGGGGGVLSRCSPHFSP